MKNTKTCSNENHDKFLHMAKIEVDAIEKLSFDALKDNVDFEDALYTINQKAHEMSKVLGLYCNVASDKDSS